eukprot:30570-Chlamydomonas_euryale.AAC.1
MCHIRRATHDAPHNAPHTLCRQAAILPQLMADLEAAMADKPVVARGRSPASRLAGGGGGHDARPATARLSAGGGLPGAGHLPASRHSVYAPAQPVSARGVVRAAGRGARGESGGGGTAG